MNVVSGALSRHRRNWAAQGQHWLGFLFQGDAVKQGLCLVHFGPVTYVEGKMPTAAAAKRIGKVMSHKGGSFIKLFTLTSPLSLDVCSPRCQVRVS